MKAIWNEVVIAQSESTVVVDGNHYFPADSVERQYLVESQTTSICGWKGTANYYSLVIDGKSNRDAAWYYPAPMPAAETIKDHLAFWRGVEIIE